jgi:hypothetical protein
VLNFGADAMLMLKAQQAWVPGVFQRLNADAVAYQTSA